MFDKTKNKLKLKFNYMNKIFINIYNETFTKSSCPK